MSSEQSRNQWREADSPQRRLQWARRYWQSRSGAVNGSATDAAKSIGIKPGTYAAYERSPGSSKWIELDHQHAITFGRKFGVSWTWLLLGEGSPFDGQLPEVQQRVIRVMEQADETQQAALADMVESWLRKAG